MEYEMIREIFNLCSGNQMRDVEVREIETDDLERFMDQYRQGGTVQCERTDSPDGKTIIFDLDCDGLRQRIGFTKL
jgi:hypothetical protein